MTTSVRFRQYPTVAEQADVYLGPEIADQKLPKPDALYSHQGVMDAATVLAALVLPIYDRLTYEQPDSILICDRGARPIGRAITYLAEALGEPLPSADQKLHYKRVSRDATPDELGAHLQPFFETLPSPYSRIAVVDELINAGITKQNFNELAQERVPDASITWNFYTGYSDDIADSVAWPGESAAVLAPWCNQPHYIGVAYKGTQPISVMSESATMFDNALREGASLVANRL